MKHHQLTCRSLLKTVILFVLAVVLTVHTPFVTATPASAPTEVQLTKLDLGMTNAEVLAALPRDETLYFNGQQWGPVVGWNPYSNSNNNAMAIAQQDNARVIMFETPYLYNMLDGKQYPLLADGPYTWNAAHTEITFKIKAAAKWSDGTPVTAHDVAYTWNTHVNYSTAVHSLEFLAQS